MFGVFLSGLRALAGLLCVGHYRALIFATVFVLFFVDVLNLEILSPSVYIRDV